MSLRRQLLSIFILNFMSRRAAAPTTTPPIPFNFPSYVTTMDVFLNQDKLEKFKDSLLLIALQQVDTRYPTPSADRADALLKASKAGSKAMTAEMYAISIIEARRKTPDAINPDNGRPYKDMPAFCVAPGRYTKDENSASMGEKPAIIALSPDFSLLYITFPKGFDNYSEEERDEQLGFFNEYLQDSHGPMKTFKNVDNITPEDLKKLSDFLQIDMYLVTDQTTKSKFLSAGDHPVGSNAGTLAFQEEFSACLQAKVGAFAAPSAAPRGASAAKAVDTVAVNASFSRDEESIVVRFESAALREAAKTYSALETQNSIVGYGLCLGFNKEKSMVTFPSQQCAELFGPLLGIKDAKQGANTIGPATILALTFKKDDPNNNLQGNIPNPVSLQKLRTS